MCIKSRVLKLEAKMKIIVGLVFGFWVDIVVLLSDGAQVSDGKISGKQYHFKYVFQCETFSLLTPMGFDNIPFGFQNGLNFLYSPMLIVLTIWLNGFQYALMDDGRSI